ncbi:hypothetical protein [Flavobacterium sp. GT3R68]|uniref:hypothetical protein n=1 Tax=Flavobacterium sp. GT3R68 TaxID=2594437 RepID=UPI000F861D8E|nr:hypothetical protein [Flavobacterium sp. GT3R68]RTY90241.1 hypothetical protein EKL32_21470 [Flavobacterium sp. GSN2]TRW90542.1 hypothetical protein FNW07_10975 [Flavobacterium sp. GT3R68]
MKNLVNIILLLLLSVNIPLAHAQIGIGTITPRGALEINSTTNGLVTPQVALTAANTSAPVVNPQTAGAPIAGTVVYNTATAGAGATAVTPGYYYWDGSLWLRLATGTNSDWAVLGNAGTVAATNFIGTTDAIDFVARTNNLERMRIKSSGEVGIGTSTPASKLDIAAAATTNTNIVNATGSINDYLQFNIQNTSNGIQAQSGYNATADNGTATTGFVWLGINSSTFNFPTSYNIGLANDVSYLGSGQDMYIANANNTKSIIFSTGKAATPFFNERMRLTNAGDFGIGTSTPAAKLDIAAAATTNTNIVNATGSINDYLQFNIQNTSTGIQAQSGYNATADNGTATTGFVWLGINNSTFNFPTAYNIGVANDVSYIASGQDMYIANANNTKSIIFSTGKAATPFFNERMRLTNAGSLGIGTTSPSNRLHIVNDADGQGVLRLDNGTAGGFVGMYFYQGASYRGHIGYVNTGGASGFGGKGAYQLAAGDRPIIFSTSSGSELYVERVIFAQDGRVGINTNPTNASVTVQPTSTLQVNGSLAIKAASVGSTSTLAEDISKVILSNGASNITITLPNPNTCSGRLISFSRNDSSTGTVTLDPTGTNNIQNLSGTVTNTTTIPLHSAGGAGVNVQFWSDGSVWYR